MAAVSDGDLQAIQAGVLAFQGQREYQAAHHGAMRWTHVKTNQRVWGSSYGPWDGSSHSGVLPCKFPVAYSEEPVMAATLSIADGEEWLGDSFPVLGASVVNWRRVEGAQMFIGADVGFSIKQYATGGQKFILTFSFYGPAVVTPVADIIGHENSTSGPSWLMADWLMADWPMVP